MLHLLKGHFVMLILLAYNTPSMISALPAAVNPQQVERIEQVVLNL